MPHRVKPQWKIQLIRNIGKPTVAFWRADRVSRQYFANRSHSLPDGIGCHQDGVGSGVGLFGASDPNGAWTYGRKSSAQGTALDVFTTQWGTDGWYLGNVGNGGPSIQGGPEMWAKDNGNGLPAIRWTCPQSGIYSVNVAFTGADSRGVDNNTFVAIDGKIVSTSTVAAYGASTKYAPKDLQLKKGDTLDFVIQWAGGVYSEYGWTTVTGQIKSVGIATTAGPAQSAIVGQSKLFTLGKFAQTNAAGPYAVDVNWGDGSADSKFSVASAGTIPLTAHTFGTAGLKTVSVVVTDALGAVSNKSTFAVTVAPAYTGTISGTVFNDVNADGKIDNGEAGMGLWRVYIDTNNNGILDTGERSVLTDFFGKWSFTALAPGKYTIRVVPVAGLVATQPTGGVLTITLAANQVSTGNLFGEKTIG